MPKEQAFETLVLEKRGKERQQYGAALAAVRGPALGSSKRSEADQDRLWMQTDSRFDDPAAFARLTVPREQGGMGLTPLAASYMKYKNRQRMIEAAGSSIDEQIAYAEHRRKRMLERPAVAPETEEPTDA